VGGTKTFVSWTVILPVDWYNSWTVEVSSWYLSDIEITKVHCAFPTVMSLDDDGWWRPCLAAAFAKQTQKLYENESRFHATILTIKRRIRYPVARRLFRKSPLNFSIPRKMIYHHLMGFHELWMDRKYGREIDPGRASAAAKSFFRIRPCQNHHLHLLVDHLT
jgi:hypothetical protein